MAYQKCTNDTINLLKNKFPNKVWNDCNEDSHIILDNLLFNLGSKILCLDTEILRKLYQEIIKGISDKNYKVPLLDIDIDPYLRQFNEYKDFDECMNEEENNNFKFNLN